MLVHLGVRHLATVERADLALEPGFNVLTGETGAGKSILLEALGLAIGERASTAAVRAGASRAEVVAAFDVAHAPGARAWLAERDLDAGDETECILRRTLSADGRSRAFINDRPVPAQTLRDLGDRLVDVHGQHAHQSLLRRETQRAILDAFGGHGDRLAAVAERQRRWAALAAELEAGGAGGGDDEARLDFLRFQLRELEPFADSLSDPASLLAEHLRLARATDLEAACAGALRSLDDDPGPAARVLVGAAARELAALRGLDERLSEPLDLLAEATVRLDEAAAALRRYLADLDTDRERFREVDRRVGALHDLARKHRSTIEDLPEVARRLRAEIEFVEGAADRRRRLGAELEAARSAYDEAAAALTRAREEAAARLARAVEERLETLGFRGARFDPEVRASTRADPGPHGRDTIEFRISANPDQPLRPLAQVASGGELSRIGLAIALIAGEGTGIPTLIFDEVDAGVGGRLADTVGACLRALAERHQVLCVTHLPQVAAHAEHHARVTKAVEGDRTRTRVERLHGEARVGEIARMLGGARVTERTIAHARELLAID